MSVSDRAKVVGERTRVYLGLPPGIPAFDSIENSDFVCVTAEDVTLSELTEWYVTVIGLTKSEAEYIKAPLTALWDMSDEFLTTVYKISMLKALKIVARVKDGFMLRPYNCGIPYDKLRDESVISNLLMERERSLKTMTRLPAAVKEYSTHISEITSDHEKVAITEPVHVPMAKNAKSLYMELFQKLGLPAPAIETTKSGMDNNPWFTSKAIVYGTTLFGDPKQTKKAAEVSLCEMALIHCENRVPKGDDNVLLLDKPAMEVYTKIRASLREEDKVIVKEKFYSNGAMAVRLVILLAVTAGVNAFDCTNPSGIVAGNFWNCSVNNVQYNECLTPFIASYYGFDARCDSLLNEAYTKHLEYDECKGLGPYLSMANYKTPLSDRVNKGICAQTLPIRKRIVKCIDAILSNNVCPLMNSEVREKLSDFKVEDNCVLQVVSDSVKCTESKSVKAGKRDMKVITAKADNYNRRPNVKRDINIVSQIADSHKVLRTGTQVLVMSPDIKLILLSISKYDFHDTFHLHGEYKYQIKLPSQYLADSVDISYTLIDNNGLLLKTGTLPVDYVALQALATLEIASIMRDLIENHKMVIIFVCILVVYIVTFLYKNVTLFRIGFDCLMAVLCFPFQVVRVVLMNLLVRPLYTAAKYSAGNNRLFMWLDTTLFRYFINADTIDDNVENGIGFYLDGVYRSVKDLSQVIINNSGPYNVGKSGTQVTSSMGRYFYKDNGQVRVLPLSVAIFLLISVVSGSPGPLVGNNGYGSCSNSIIIPATFTNCDVEFCEVDVTFEVDLEIGDSVCLTLFSSSDGINRTAHMELTVDDFTFKRTCALSYATGVVEPLTRSYHECASLFSHNPLCATAVINSIASAESLTGHYGAFDSNSYAYMHVVASTASGGCITEGCISCLDGCDHAELIAEVHAGFCDVLLCGQHEPELKMLFQFLDKEGVGGSSWHDDFIMTSTQGTHTSHTFTVDHQIIGIGLDNDVASLYGNTLLDHKRYLVDEPLNSNYPNRPALLGSNYSVSLKDFPILGTIGEIQFSGIGGWEDPVKHKYASGIFTPRFITGHTHSVEWLVKQRLTESYLDDVLDQNMIGTVKGNYNFRDYDPNTGVATVGVNRFEAVRTQFRMVGLPTFTFAFTTACPKIVALRMEGEAGCSKCAFIIVTAKSTCEGGDVHVDILEGDENITTSDHRLVLSSAEMEYKLAFTVYEQNVDLCVKLSTVGHSDTMCSSKTFNTTALFSTGGKLNFTGEQTSITENDGLMSGAFGFIDTGIKWLNSALRIGFIILICVSGIVVMVAVAYVLGLMRHVSVSDIARKMQ